MFEIESCAASDTIRQSIYVLYSLMLNIWVVYKTSTILYYFDVFTLDVNECQTLTDNCQQVCTNTEGSYTCSCSTGFELDSDRLTCNGTCNTQGEYETLMPPNTSHSYFQYKPEMSVVISNAASAQWWMVQKSVAVLVDFH